MIISKKYASSIFSMCLILFTTVTMLNARELRCNISINSSKIPGVGRSVFNTLQSSLNEFMNGTKWTNNTFAIEELIDCSFLITLTEQSGAGRYGGTLHVQARRPIYGTSYQSVTLNYVDDDFVIDYVEFDRLDFDVKVFTSNLTSIMAFYAYIILGVDFDTFSLKGGDEYFEAANRILNNAQKESYPGWNPYESSSKRNRYWLIENITDIKYAAERSAYYKYHRLGMDMLADKPAIARDNIVQALKDIQKVYQDRPDPYLFYVRVFFDAKSDELVDIFSESPEPERQAVFRILNEIDNNNAKKYERINKP